MALIKRVKLTQKFEKMAPVNQKKLQKKLRMIHFSHFV